MWRTSCGLRLGVTIVDRQCAPQNAHENKESGSQPLQVDHRGGEISLDLHVTEAASERSGEPVPGLGLAVDAFDPSAVGSIDRLLPATPGEVLAPGPDQGGMILVQQDGSSLRRRAEAASPQRAGRTILDCGTVSLEAIRIRFAVGPQGAPARAAHMVVTRV